MPYNTGMTNITNTAFKEGREFRLLQPIDTTAGFQTIRVTAPINFVLKLQRLLGSESIVTMFAYRSAQGVATGIWTPSIYYANNNQQNGVTYVGQVSVDVGGVFTPADDDLYKDKLHVKVATSTAQATNVGDDAIAERGLPPETYYLVFRGSGKADYNLLLEERP